MSATWVYVFHNVNERPSGVEGCKMSDKETRTHALLGGKGANLAEMASIGLPVPPGFTITTKCCAHFYKNNQQFPLGLQEQVQAAIRDLEARMGKGFGDSNNPLLLSVRSGAPISMPGMMDTVLNLGLNDESVQGLVRESNDARFAWDSYRRFIQMYANVVLGVPSSHFESVLEEAKQSRGYENDTQMTAEDLQALVMQYKSLFKAGLGKDFPQDPQEQLWSAIGAVFSSWQTPRAVTYRKIHRIPGDLGTAVNVQTMVFGNMGDDCATGVAFTRDPSTGENYFYGEYLPNAQGEDVVAGIRTPHSLTNHAREKDGNTLATLEETMPELYRQLAEVRLRLEEHYHDMQDIEFTIERGHLYMLQTRTGKRTAAAALKIAIDMVDEGHISKDEAVLRVSPASLEQLLHPRIDPRAPREVVGKGLAASPGAACGAVVFSADDAEARARTGERVILARSDTSPEDIHGMSAAVGIVTTRGGMTSHAAVVARGMGRPCVAGASGLQVNYEKQELTAGEHVIRQGDIITLDGGTGEVMLGRVPTIEPDLSGDFARVLEWADERRTMAVQANAETQADARKARSFLADGIGLCRTEHMFFAPARIQHVREMIFASNKEARCAALAQLEPAQRDDFASLFREMTGKPLTIRLLDPPLHEFLPRGETEVREFAERMGLEVNAVRRRLHDLTEANPMLGHRGARVGISYPEIYEMQVRAILNAALDVKEEAERSGSASGGAKTVIPKVMLPLILDAREFVILRELADRIANEVFAQRGGSRIDYQVGTMVELPRACLRAKSIAEHADFFSFGTNDLTQTTMGLSRDDSGAFLPRYVEQGIFESDPFVSIDESGVGELIEMAFQRGRTGNASLEVGICGEHGGDPDSIAFCCRTGLDYVSCSPFRVPIARLAAAHAALTKQ